MKPLYKTTIIIWSEFNPYTRNVDMQDLVYEAQEGDAYCSDQRTILVQVPERDPEWDGTDFFNHEEEKDEN
jgi:hypothetical protein